MQNFQSEAFNILSTIIALYLIYCAVIGGGKLFENDAFKYDEEGKKKYRLVMRIGLIVVAVLLLIVNTAFFMGFKSVLIDVAWYGAIGCAVLLIIVTTTIAYNSRQKMNKILDKEFEEKNKDKNTEK